MIEALLGELAKQHAKAVEVQQLGDHMVADHIKANEEVTTLSKAKDVTPSAALDAEHKTAVEKLGETRAAAFDKALMAQMVVDHRQSVALLETAATSAKDFEIKAFATKRLPTLEAHLSVAQTTSKSSAKASSS